MRRRLVQRMLDNLAAVLCDGPLCAGYAMRDRKAIDIDRPPAVLANPAIALIDR